MEAVNSRPSLDIAAIFRRYGADFLKQHRLCIDQLNAYQAICACRTSALGGHIDQCDQCGHHQVSYNSCRNRHCPKCQYTKQLAWVDKLSSSLPVCRYFHLVFTLPSLLHKTFYLNQRICYDLLFKASAQALGKVSKHPKFLGAQTGAVAVLHSWGQALTYHPHIHMLVPAGGLSEDGTEWIRAGQKFFLPVKVLGAVFRGVLWSLLETAIRTGKVQLADTFSEIKELKAAVYSKRWNVYAKKPLASPNSVVRYLGRYSHRIAISNSRLVSMDHGKITFRWKDYRKRLSNQLLTLEAQEFIGRFIRHVLPKGFYKIRYYGLLASANRSKKQTCMALIGGEQPVALLQGLTARQVIKTVTGKDPDQCPKCKRGMLIPKTILDPV